MKRNLKFLTTVALVMALFASFFTFAGEMDGKVITILQTSDMHGRIYPHDYATDSSDADAGLAKISTLVKQIRTEQENVILIDTGDTVQDNSAELFNNDEVHPMVKAMNLMDYDLWVLGNHEFNFDLDFLKKNVAAFEGSVLSANIYNKGTETRWLDGYKIIEMDGVRVAIIGMIPPHIPTWEASAPEHYAGLEFKSVLEETGKAIKELEGKYDVLIGAYHIGPEGEHGYEGLETIAESYPEFDLLLGGHAHAKYMNEVNGVTIMEPGKYGWALNKVDITVKDGQVTFLQGEQIETKSVDPDQEIVDAFKYVHDKSVADANIVVGKITEDFISNPDYITGMDEIKTMPTAQLIDTSVIDLINEVQMFYADSEISSAALFNFGSNLKMGDFKKKDVAYIYKYPNTLNGVYITGENLLKYMEWSASYYNTKEDGDVTVSFNPDIRGYNYDMFSGVNYEIDLTMKAGSRVKNVTFNGQAIAPERKYKLAVNNYRFGTLLKLGLVTMEDEYYNSYDLMQDAGRIRDLIVKYTAEEKGGILKPTVDNNWKLVGVDLEIPNKEDLAKEILAGTIIVPTSEDGRTKNVKSLKMKDLMDAGIIQGRRYKVKSGDMLWKIAKKNGVKWQDIKELNNLKNPNMIFPGQELLLPMAE